MARRREFSKAVYVQIVHRATVNGVVACEGCGLVLGKKPYQVDHIDPDALQIDKSRKLTAADGQLLGVDCCHREKTKTDVKNIAKAKRREARDLGIPGPVAKIKSAPFRKSTKSSRRQEHGDRPALPFKRLFADAREA